MRLIDADALNEKLCETTIFIKDGVAFQRMINDAPTIDAVQVVRWNPAKHEYEPYDLPDGASCYEEDMDKVVHCAQCGRAVIYGDTYTSLEVHTQIGFGYAVCHECHEAEVTRRKEADYATDK